MDRAPGGDRGLEEILKRELNAFYEELESGVTPKREKRKDVRVPTGLIMPYQMYRDGTWVEGRSALLSLNLSGSGMKVLLDAPLRVGEYLHIEARLDPTIPVYVMGCLRWVTPSHVSGRFLAGLAFVRLDPRIRRVLTNYVEFLKEEHGREYFKIKSLAGKERRRFFRIEKRLPLRYQVYAGERWHKGEGEMLTLNLGGGGVQILTSEPLAKWNVLTVYLPLDEEILSLMGKVQWVRQLEPQKNFWAGVEFLNVTDDNRDKILRYLFKEQVRERRKRVRGGIPEEGG